MEHIDIYKILDSISINEGFKSFDQALTIAAPVILNSIVTNSMLEVSKQTAEKQREICGLSVKFHADFENLTNENLDHWIDKESIINAPAPEIK